MKSIYQLLLDAQDQLNWETITKLAAVMETHYHWSAGTLASELDLKTLCSQLCFEAEMQQQRNEQKGQPQKEISISSGCWTVSVFYFSQTPFVSISFGFHRTAQ